MKAQEIVRGIVVPDVFKEPDFVKTSYDKFTSIVKADYNKNRVLNTALVRKLMHEVIFNGKLKLKFPLNKAGVGHTLNEMYKNFDSSEFQWRYLLFIRAGFFLSSYSPSSFSTDSLALPDKFKPVKQAILDQFNRDKEKDENKALIVADAAFEKLAEDVLAYFREHREAYPIVDLIDSGAKGGTSDIRKLLVSIGLSINSAGKVNDVITRSHSEGLTQTQFFNYSSQAIVSQYQKSVETAVPGYLIRKLNTLMAGVTLSSDTDCGTTRFLKVKVANKQMLEALDGRLHKTTTGLKSISPDDDLVGKYVSLRSPLYCTSPDGICHNCYNPKFIKTMDIPNNGKIGLLASTSSANMLTSLTLKAAHTGLSLNAEAIDLAHDIIEYSE